MLLSTCAAASMLGPMLLLLLHTSWHPHGHDMTDKGQRILLPAAVAQQLQHVRPCRDTSRAMSSNEVSHLTSQPEYAKEEVRCLFECSLLLSGPAYCLESSENQTVMKDGKEKRRS